MHLIILVDGEQISIFRMFCLLIQRIFFQFYIMRGRALFSCVYVMHSFLLIIMLCLDNLHYAVLIKLFQHPIFTDFTLIGYYKSEKEA